MATSDTGAFTKMAFLKTGLGILLGWKLSPVVFYYQLTLRNAT